MLACCASFRHEFKSAMFDLTEHAPSPPTSPSAGEPGANVHGDAPPALDIGETLSPRPRLLFIGAKVFIMAWVVSVMALSIINETHQSFWLAYLTFWGVTGTAAYTIMSCVCAIYLAMRPPENPGKLEGGVGLLVKTTWALLSIIAPAELVITILYWVLLFDGDFDYLNVMTHGGCMVLVIIDGFFLSRLPLRLKQILLFEAFSIIYILWSVIHAYSGVGNPYKDDGTQTDDAIYEPLAWKNETVSALILSLLIFFVINPVVFLLLRAVSRLAPRRLCKLDEGERRFSKPVAVEDEEAAAVVY